MKKYIVSLIETIKAKNEKEALIKFEDMLEISEYDNAKIEIYEVSKKRGIKC